MAHFALSNKGGKGPSGAFLGFFKIRYITEGNIAKIERNRHRELRVQYIIQ